MSNTMTTATLPSRSRVRIFVDFWNLQLTMNERESKHKGSSSYSDGFLIDWTEFPKYLVSNVKRLVGGECTFEGMTVYTSYDSRSPGGRKHHHWATSWLDRQPGVQVECLERQPKHPPKCHRCYALISRCPHCGEQMGGTVEKGVDTAIATDMIRLAWEQAYDVALLVTSDADLVPAVEFLEVRGLKILQGGFPPHGSHLARACWAAFDLFKDRAQFRRE